MKNKLEDHLNYLKEQRDTFNRIVSNYEIRIECMENEIFYIQEMLDDFNEIEIVD
jgi:predicted  nucleic acid-binding Zn-ribbon protein